jgi:monoterpene epsilon-lactone hydrolase
LYISVEIIMTQISQSKKSEANKRHYEALAAQSSQQLSPEEGIEWNDIHWTALTAEPGGVDYFEVDANSVPAMWIVPKGCVEDRVILYAHGGGFVGGSIYTHRKMVGHLAKAVGCRALMFEYDYAHQHKYPHQLNTAVAAYRWLLAQGIKAEHIAMAGDSAGVLLTFGTLQRARDEGLPQPAAVMTISGWTDLDVTGESYESNRQNDPFFIKETVSWLAGHVLGEGGDRRDPYASPLYADMKGFPPIFMQAGAHEGLLDDSRVFAERAKKAGVEVRLDIFPGMLHSFQMMAGRAPEADDAIARFAEWVRPKLGLTATNRAKIS